MRKIEESENHDANNSTLIFRLGSRESEGIGVGEMDGEVIYR